MSDLLLLGFGGFALFSGGLCLGLEYQRRLLHSLRSHLLLLEAYTHQTDAEFLAFGHELAEILASIPERSRPQLQQDIATLLEARFAKRYNLF